MAQRIEFSGSITVPAGVTAEQIETLLKKHLPVLDEAGAKEGEIAVDYLNTEIKSFRPIASDESVVTLNRRCDGVVEEDVDYVVKTEDLQEAVQDSDGDLKAAFDNLSDNGLLERIDWSSSVEEITEEHERTVTCSKSIEELTNTEFED